MSAHSKHLGTSADSRIENGAADWLVRRNAGLSPTDTHQFSSWLEADPRHRATFAELDAAWAKLTFPERVGRVGEVKRQLAARARRRGRQRMVAAGAAVLLAVTGLVGVRADRWVLRESSVVVSTVTPRPNVQTLPDGTRVELNADAEIAVEFTPEARAVRLLRGEALFSVVKDPARHFVVSAGEVAVRAVGTAFAVRYGAATTGVLVTEGRVAVARTSISATPDGAANSAPAEPILLAVGGKLDLPADPTRSPVMAPAALSATEMAAELAWRGHRVEFTRTTLADAVALFNRQNRVQLTIKDAATARITISGVFWANNPESFVRLLGSGFQIEALRTGDRIALRGR